MKISIYLAVGLIAVAFVIGLGAGYYFTPEYRLTMYEKNSMDLGPADRGFDRRYLNSMIAHHRGAMLLAGQAKDIAVRPEIKELAETILQEEPKAIDELYAWKKAWYRDARPVRDPVTTQLGSSDSTSDLRFLNALIYHHEAGIAMAQEAKQKSQRGAVLDNADAVINFLTESTAQLKDWRLSWYGI